MISLSGLEKAKDRLGHGSEKGHVATLSCGHKRGFDPGYNKKPSWLNCATCGSARSVRDIGHGSDRRLGYGARVRVVEGSGLDSNRVGTIVSHKGMEQHTAMGVQGRYHPFDPKREHLVRDDNGQHFTMFKSRLELMLNPKSMSKAKDRLGHGSEKHGGFKTTELPNGIIAVKRSGTPNYVQGMQRHYAERLSGKWTPDSSRPSCTCNKGHDYPDWCEHKNAAYEHVRAKADAALNEDDENDQSGRWVPVRKITDVVRPKRKLGDLVKGATIVATSATIVEKSGEKPPDEAPDEPIDKAKDAKGHGSEKHGGGGNNYFTQRVTEPLSYVPVKHTCGHAELRYARLYPERAHHDPVPHLVAGNKCTKCGKEGRPEQENFANVEEAAKVAHERNKHDPRQADFSKRALDEDLLDEPLKKKKDAKGHGSDKRSERRYEAPDGKRYTKSEIEQAIAETKTHMRVFKDPHDTHIVDHKGEMNSAAELLNHYRAARHSGTDDAMMAIAQNLRDGILRLANDDEVSDAGKYTPCGAHAQTPGYGDSACMGCRDAHAQKLSYLNHEDRMAHEISEELGQQV